MGIFTGLNYEESRFGSLPCFSDEIDEVNPTCAVNKQWYALSVKSRHESVTYNELLRKGIETYLPLIKRIRQWKDRKKCVEFPLFPGYLFVHIAMAQEPILNVLRTKGAVGFVSLEAHIPTQVPSVEINSLRILLESDEKFDIYPNLKEGMRIRVKKGALNGAEGVMMKKKDNFMFLVGIELFGRSIAVKICPDDMEPF